MSLCSLLTQDPLYALQRKGIFGTAISLWTVVTKAKSAEQEEMRNCEGDEERCIVSVNIIRLMQWVSSIT